MAKSIDTTVFGPLRDEVEDGPKVASASLATPWARYWSRMLYLTFGLYTVGFMIGVISPGLAHLSTSSGRMGELLLGLVSTPFVMIMDAGVLALFGTTLGRLIAGIRVETIEHAKVPFVICLRRNGFIYVYGIGLGVPVVSLITLFGSFSQVNDGQLSRWDARLRTRVYDRGGALWRTAITAALYILVGAVPSVLAAMRGSAG